MCSEEIALTHTTRHVKKTSYSLAMGFYWMSIPNETLRREQLNYKEYNPCTKFKIPCRISTNSILMISCIAYTSSFCYFQGPLQWICSENQLDCYCNTRSLALVQISSNRRRNVDQCVRSYVLRCKCVEWVDKCIMKMVMNIHYSKRGNYNVVAFITCTRTTYGHGENRQLSCGSAHKFHVHHFIAWVIPIRYNYGGVLVLLWVYSISLGLYCLYFLKNLTQYVRFYSLRDIVMAWN